MRGWAEAREGWSLRAIDSRVAERRRRLAHASDEELDRLLVERDLQLRQDLAKITDFDDPE